MDVTIAEVKLERVDELPILLHALHQLHLAQWIDEAFPHPHGDRRGLSYGQLSVILIAFIMSRSEHRRCAVEEWVRTHHTSLEALTRCAIGDKDATDDRMGALVEVLGRHKEGRMEVEQQIGGQMIRAYGLPTEVGRCDTSSFSVYHHLESQDQSEALLRFGNSKDHRPDLRQYRQALGTLDPARIPLVSATLLGNGAHDPVYVPMWERMHQVIGHRDFVFIADCKAGVQGTRAQIDRQGGIYCVPIATTARVGEILKHWVLQPPQRLNPFTCPRADLSVVENRE